MTVTSEKKRKKKKKKKKNRAKQKTQESITAVISSNYSRRLCFWILEVFSS